MRALRQCSPILGLLMLLASAVTAKANVIYMYTGNPLTLCSGPGCVASAPFPEITASFTFGSPLGAFFSGGIAPSIYEINDGINILNNTNSTLDGALTAVGTVDVTTNGSGAISQWDFGAFGEFVGGFDFPYTYNGSNGAEDSGGKNANLGSPGTWAVGGITGTIGSQGPAVYYSFLWGGGAFSASASIGLTPLQQLQDSFFYTMGSSASGCTDQASEILDSVDGFSGSITSPHLAAGTYCIGFNPFTGNIDPPYTLTFNTPVGEVTALTTPEPSGFVLLCVGWGVIGLLRLRKARPNENRALTFTAPSEPGEFAGSF